MVEKSESPDLQSEWLEVAMEMFAVFAEVAPKLVWIDVRERAWLLCSDILKGPNRDRMPEQFARSFWKCIEALLFSYSLAVATASRDGGEPPIFPPWAAEMLGGIAGYLGAGKVVPFIASVNKGGTPATGPTERSHIRRAVAYRLACGPQGLLVGGQIVRIDDRAPVKTLMRWFGVKKPTVQQWVRLHQNGAGDFLLGPTTPGILAHLAEKAGEHYRSAKSTEKGSDDDLLSEVTADVANRMMDMEVESLTGAAYDERSMNAPIVATVNESVHRRRRDLRQGKG